MIGDITRRRLILALFMLIAIPSWFSTVNAAGRIVVCSARIESLIKPLFDVYTQETGTEVVFVTDKEEALNVRLKNEGERTPADILMTVDAGNLWLASQDGLLRPTNSIVLNTNIPSHLRDPNGEWFGLSVRARTAVYNSTKVKPAELSTYEQLAAPVWQGRLCLRSSKKVYNQSLVAMLIQEYGENKAEEIVRGWVKNLATVPFADDNAALQAVAAGQCDVTLVNTYYYARLMEKNPRLPLTIFWLNQIPNLPTTGVHVNISGAGITRYAKNPQGALHLLEWLSSEKAQNRYADENFEYPANPRVKPAAFIREWGSFQSNPINVRQAGQLQSVAVRLMDRAGYK